MENSEHNKASGKDGAEHASHHHHVEPSFANPLGEGTIEDFEPSPTDGAQVEALEFGDKSKAQGAEEPVLASDIVPVLDLDSANTVQDEGATEMVAIDEVTISTQVTALGADKWVEDYKVRVEKLQQDVDELNSRLDRIRRHKA